MNRILLFCMPVWLSLLMVLGLSAAAYAEAAPAALVFRPDATLDYGQLLQLMRRSSPTLKPAERQATLAKLETEQARLYGNPTLDAAWGTLPVGATNPADLAHPWANVPNYGVGLGYTFPIAKRGPRIRQAQALAVGASAELEAEARDGALLLASVLGELATATLRREGLRELVEGAARAVALAEARLQAKFGTPLELDRLVVDMRRSEQLVLNVEADVQASLAECSRLVGASCQTFADTAAARGYLEHWLSLELPPTDRLEQRPDLRALSAYVAASHAEEALARAQAIPDPSVRVGYMHDRFVISGNQRNSLNVSLSLPLPVFDHGQVQARAARAAAQSLATEHGQRLATASARIPMLRQRLELQRARCANLDADVLPKAQSVLHSLEQAVENRLIPLSDVIQARRTLSELLIERAQTCGDAHAATLELIRETSQRESMP